MRQTKTIVCAVPRGCWQEQAIGGRDHHGRIQALLKDLVVLERRIGKGVNLDEERVRYSKCCSLIEGIAGENARPFAKKAKIKDVILRGRFPSIEVGPVYAELLRGWFEVGEPLGAAAPGRLGASVIPPDGLAENDRAARVAAKSLGYARDESLRARSRFLREVQKRYGCGIVEVPDPLHDGPPPAPPRLPAPPGSAFGKLSRRLLVRIGAVPALRTPSRRTARGESDDWEKYESNVKDRGAFIEERLREQVRNALESGGTANVGGQQRHETTTEILNGFTSRRAKETPGEVRLIYGDGSEARPFPLRCLPPVPRSFRPRHELHVALMSMRHLELDRHIDINWYRNVDVPKSETMAIADEWCFTTSLEQLEELKKLYGGEALLFRMYHTGFDPAVIGFYRAVVTKLEEARKPWLRVVPMYARPGGRFEEGSPWPR